MTGYETLLVEVRDHGIAWVTINRPESHNAFNEQMRHEFRRLWRAFREDDAVQVIVLTAAGDQAFCVGVDRSEPFSALDDHPGLYGTSNNFMYDDPGDYLGPKANDLWKPVIGAVNGMACGGAFYFLGECDILIGADHATFFDPHVTYGQASVYEPVTMLKHMPFGELMRMVLTGNAERISASTALRMGLLTEVVPYDELAAAAERLAGAIAANPPWAVQGSQRAVWAAHDLGRLGARQTATSILTTATDTTDMARGADAFSLGVRQEPRIR